MVKKIGILDEIKKIVDIETSKQIEEIAYQSNLFVLSIAWIKKLTKEDLEKEYEHNYKVKFPDRDFETFVKYKEGWNEDKYRFGAEPQGFFLDEKTAVEYAQANMGDINEAGSYPYAIVSSMPLNRVYPTANKRTHRLFEYCHKDDGYHEISWERDESTKLLLKYGESGGF